MSLSTQKVRNLISELSTNQALKEEYESHPEKTLKTKASEDPKNDIRAYRIVVGVLSLLILSIVIGLYIIYPNSRLPIR